ncbi:hypothetical protein QJS04_geneDACA010514 [Acorus gramineus]|uniref:Rubisco LSMT substrate-binding domain-containing protein n=1 Tax=Acorus gramineus TaxID=55184 RepID=A0AAV9AK21_ACOGR|nr:hypothetical protein QJS04_geneDACA010514 [Acorus gramineus]
MCTMKLDLLHRHRMPMLTNINGSGSSGNSFTIREVRSCQGKGKGIPQSLRAFARVLSIESPEELKDLEAEAAEHDGRLGRRPLKNIENEIKANQILISKISHMIQNHDVSIKSLNSFSCANGGPHDLRRRMTEDLLAGELRVLKSALAWLVNYSARLSNSKATDVDGGS